MKKIIIVLVSSLTLLGLLLWAVPVLAADSGAPSARNLPQAGHVKVLLRLMLIQDEAKVDALLAGAEDTGRLTLEQASKIKDFWTQHHTQFSRNIVLRRLLNVKNEARVEEFLNKAIQSGKIKPEQSENILRIWKIFHSPA
jgi:hypothetical protein